MQSEERGVDRRRAATARGVDLRLHHPDDNKRRGQHHEHNAEEKQEPHRELPTRARGSGKELNCKERGHNKDDHIPRESTGESKDGHDVGHKHGGDVRDGADEERLAVEECIRRRGALCAARGDDRNDVSLAPLVRRRRHQARHLHDKRVQADPGGEQQERVRPNHRDGHRELSACEQHSVDQAQACFVVQQNVRCGLAAEMNVSEGRGWGREGEQRTGA